MLGRNFSTLLVLGCLLSDLTLAQTNRVKPAKPSKSPDGKWRPTNRRRPVVNRPTSNKPANTAVGRRPTIDRSTIVTPPLRRHPGELPLQKPSWIHCLNSIEVSSNWATVSSTGYPDGIGGQLQCTWSFYGAAGFRLRLSFDDMDLQEGISGRCAAQFVDVIDMEAQKSQGRFCGGKVPGDYVTLGSQLRLDIQADHSVIAHKGFMASVRLEPLSVQPGMRGRSLRRDGPVVTTTKRPPRIRLTPRSPPPLGVNGNTPLRNRVGNFPRFRNRGGNPGQNMYGQNIQPRRLEPETTSSSGLASGAYAAIAVVCVLIITIGVACVFRKSIYMKVQKHRGKQIDKHEKDNSFPPDNYHADRFPLPGDVPRFNPYFEPDRRRRSVIFEDEYLAAIEFDRRRQESGMIPMYADQDSEIRRFQNYGDIPQDMWKSGHQTGDYLHSESGYDDDVASVRSTESTRSSMRHPDHAQLKKKKMVERANSIMRNDNALTTMSEPAVYGQTRIYAPVQVDRSHYDDIVNQQRQEGAVRMQRLMGAQSMTDISQLEPIPVRARLPRAMSVADISEGGAFPRRQMQRRQSFYM